MIRVGLTGGIASGKSTVAQLLAERGAVLVDSDVLAREAVASGTPGLASVVARFGAEVLDGDRLDRPALARVVFGDPAARRDLEAIVHPLVRARARELEARQPEDAVVVHVIPLLVETGQQHDFDLVVVVDVSPDVQRQRLMARNGLSAAEAEARVAAQASRAERLAAADTVVHNDGPLADLREQVDNVWSQLRPGGSLT